MPGARRENLVAWMFVAPAVLLLGLFVFWPMVQMVLTSLRQTSLIDMYGGQFVGVANYRDLLGDRVFRESFRNTALFALLVTPLQTVAALLLAVWVNGEGLSRRFLRVAVFLPTTVSLAVLSVLWDLMLEPASATGAGLVNGLLRSVGLPTQLFLASPRQALLVIVLISAWQGVGFQMMIFLAGLQQVPAERYEAARLDGAGRVGQFVHITLPGIAPTTVFVVMFTTIFAFKLFAQPYIMTRGGPDGATRSVVQYVYETAFQQRDLGLACAAAVLFFAVVLLVSLAQRWLSRRAEALA